MGSRVTVGFYTEGKGKNREIHPIQASPGRIKHVLGVLSRVRGSRVEPYYLKHSHVRVVKHVKQGEANRPEKTHHVEEKHHAHGGEPGGRPHSAQAVSAAKSGGEEVPSVSSLIYKRLRQGAPPTKEGYAAELEEERRSYLHEAEDVREHGYKYYDKENGSVVEKRLPPTHPLSKLRIAFLENRAKRKELERREILYGEKHDKEKQRLEDEVTEIAKKIARYPK